VKAPHSFFVITLVFLCCIAVRPVCAQNSDSTKSAATLKEVPLKEAEARHKPGDTVAVVNGVLITFADFNSIMSGYLKSIVARTKNNVITDTVYTEIVDSAWDRALSDIIIEHEIEKRRLGMSVAEIKTALIASPPDFLRQQFSDSLGQFRSEIMRKALDDPRNDTVVSVIVESERVRLETDRLAASIAKSSITKKGATNAEREQAFAAWLKKAKRNASIDDRRTRFGFY
jgi:hypothetical protein